MYGNYNSEALLTCANQSHEINDSYQRLQRPHALPSYRRAMQQGPDLAQENERL